MNKISIQINVPGAASWDAIKATFHTIPDESFGLVCQAVADATGRLVRATRIPVSLTEAATQELVGRLSGVYFHPKHSPDYYHQPLTLKQLNAAIDERFRGMYLVAGHTEAEGNFFQLTSEVEKLAGMISRLPVSRIYVKGITDLTVEQWIIAVLELIELEPRG